jgi:hypothetical protein
VRATHPGYLATESTARVVAGDGQPPLVRLQLQADASGGTYTELQHWRGFIECGVGSDGEGQEAANHSYLPCALANSAVATDNIHDFFFGGTRVPDVAQAELVWSGTQPLGNDLQLDFPSTGPNLSGGKGDWAVVAGPSPLVLAGNATQIRAGLGNSTEHVDVRVLAGTTQLATLTLQQGFDVYMTYFYGFAPRPGWTMFSDGPCDSPAQCG